MRKVERVSDKLSVYLPTSHTWGRITVDTVEAQARLNSGGNRGLRPFKPVLTPISKNDTNPQPSWQINKIVVVVVLALLFFRPSEIFNVELMAPYGCPKYPSSALSNKHPFFPSLSLPQRNIFPTIRTEV